MSWTKRQLIEAAFEEIALAGYVFDLSSQMIVSALGSLDSMMAAWSDDGIRIGYAGTVDPKASDPDQESGIPDGANETVYQNLAIRLAARFGKALPPELKALAKSGYDRLLAKALSTPPEVQLPGTMPVGAGHKYRINPFMPRPCDRLETGPDGTLDFK